jgi:hypothetical protein
MTPIFGGQLGQNTLPKDMTARLISRTDKNFLDIKKLSRKIANIILEK